MPIDRNSESGETAEPSIEQRIEQGRAARDAWRAADWDKIDRATKLDQHFYDREPEPFTIEELTAGQDNETAPESAYRDPSDVRDALLSGESASDVRQALREQGADTGSEPTTELVRERDGLRYEHGTPPENVEQFGEKVATEESDKISRRERKLDAWQTAAGDGADKAKKFANQAQDALTHRLPPGSRGETTVRQDAPPIIENRQTDGIDSGNVLAGVLATMVAGSVILRRVNERWHERREQSKE